MSIQPECRWCGAPATREVELEPAEVVRHRDGSLQFVRQSISVPACARHPTAEQAPAPVTPHRTAAKADEVDQLGLWDRRVRDAARGTDMEADDDPAHL